MELKKLPALLKVLRENGVEHFKSGQMEIHLHLSALKTIGLPMDEEPAPARAAPRDEDEPGEKRKRRDDPDLFMSAGGV